MAEEEQEYQGIINRFAGFNACGLGVESWHKKRKVFSTFLESSEKVGSC
jgi:hypothetical protein